MGKGITNTEFLRSRCLEIAPSVDSNSYEHMKLRERSPEFRKLKNNRLIMGALRYGKLGAKNKPQYDRMQGICHHLKMYEKTGNLEHLVDISNIAECEFVESIHPKKHFKAADDGVHVKRKG